MFATDTTSPPYHARTTGYVGGSYVNHYWVKETPGWSFQVTTSPSASGTGPGASATVSYAATATPVFLVISGVLSSSDKRPMIGQKLSAEVVGCEPFESEYDTYTWHISAGSPFSAYSANDSSASYTGWSSPNAASMYCHFAQPSGAITVSVEVTHENLGVSFELEDDVGAVAPSFSTALYLGSRDLLSGSNPNFTVDYMNPTRLALWNMTYSGITWGIFYVGTVTTPSDFVIGSDKGKWGWTQIVTSSSASFRDANFDDWVWDDQFTNDLYLDKHHPYNNQKFDADSYSHFTNDSPSMPILSGWVRLSRSDVFDLYSFYWAPKTDSIEVPLEKYTWNWNGIGTKPVSGPPWQVTGIQGSAKAGNYPAHPEWSKDITSILPAQFHKIP